MPHILKMTLKKQWFDMIHRGDKKEEYREIKWYWLRRILWNSKYLTKAQRELLIKDLNKFGTRFCNWGSLEDLFNSYGVTLIPYAGIEFTNGYGRKMPRMTIECTGITIGQPKRKWYDKTSGVIPRRLIFKLGIVVSSNRK